MAQSRNSFPNEMLPCTTLATQKYKGVRMRPEWGAWVTETQDPNTKKRIWLGSYHTAEMAARAYDAAVVCLKGPSYPKLNFPYALFNPDQDWPCTDHEVIKAIARAAAYAPISSSIPAAHNATQNFLPMAEAQSSAETRRSSRSPSAVSKLWECWIDNLEFENSTADSSHMVQDAQDPYMSAELERSLRSGHPIEEIFCSDELRVFNRIHHVHPERDD